MLNRQYSNQDSANELKNVRNIFNCLDIFFMLLVTRNAQTYTQLKENNYLQLLNMIDYEDPRLPDEVLGISRIKDQQEREQQISIFLQKYKNTINGLFYEAWFNMEQGAYEIARKQYVFFIQRYKDRSTIKNAKAHHNLAVLLTRYYKDYIGAAEHYRAAVQLDPQFSGSYFSLALLLEVYLNDPDGAVIHYQSAIRINQQDAAAHYNLARLLKNHFKQYDKAISHYNAAININPVYADAHYNLALLLHDLQRFNEAVHHYAAAVRINPLDAEALNNLGVIYYNQYRDYVNARKYFEAASRAAPQHEQVQKNLKLNFGHA